MVWKATQMETEHRHQELVDHLTLDTFDDDAEQIDMIARDRDYERLAQNKKRPAAKVVLQQDNNDCWGITKYWRMALDVQVDI